MRSAVMTIVLGVCCGCSQPVVLPRVEDFDGDFKGQWLVVDQTNKQSDWGILQGKYQQRADVGSISHHGVLDGIYHLGTYADLEGGAGLENYRIDLDMSIA